MHHYKDFGEKFRLKGISSIPDKYGGKTPLIKGWTEFCQRLPTEEEVNDWVNNFTESNVAICCGSASGIVALDFDACDPKVIELIEPVLPPSPVERKGAKNWVRFFRYNGEETYSVQFNGETVLELLSTGKKVTIIGKHPSGMDYKFGDKTLLDIDQGKLPLIPPALIAHVESKLRLAFPDLVQNKLGKVISGRNDALSSHCGKLIASNLPLSDLIQCLIDEDEKLHPDNPLFSDEHEFNCTERYTNALTFYANHLRTINTKRFRDNKAYEIPVIESAVNMVYAEEILTKKLEAPSLKRGLSKNTGSLPEPVGILRDIQQNILENSYIEQPTFALGAAIVTLGTAIGRKFVFQGSVSNLYVLNVGKSGSGKDACQQKVKEILSLANAESLIGSGDYVSDASLVDELEIKPVRLDIVDEASGLFGAMNKADTHYNSKMADILAELYTTSNSIFLGRSTAGGRKGQCHRPCVSILASTTPTGFQDSITIKNIEKGLIGRFIVFEGIDDQPARRLTKRTFMDDSAIKRLRYLIDFEPRESAVMTTYKQPVYSIQSTLEANSLLEKYFRDWDDQRIMYASNRAMIPIIARLYQQMAKICMIHACSRINLNGNRVQKLPDGTVVDYPVPVVDVIDVEFAHGIVADYYRRVERIIEDNIFANKDEAELVKVLRLINDHGAKGVKHSQLTSFTKFLRKQRRDEILEQLKESEKIVCKYTGTGAKNLYYFGVEYAATNDR